MCSQNLITRSSSSFSARGRRGNQSFSLPVHYSSARHCPFFLLTHDLTLRRGNRRDSKARLPWAQPHSALKNRVQRFLGRKCQGMGYLDEDNQDKEHYLVSKTKLPALLKAFQRLPSSKKSASFFCLARASRVTPLPPRITFLLTMKAKKKKKKQGHP